MSLDEADLVGHAQAGDWDSFEVLVDQHRELLARTAYLATRDRDAVEDVVQETLIEAWRGLPSYRPYGSFKAWLIKILMNRARKRYRRKRVQTAPLAEAAALLGGRDGPERAVLRQEEAACVREAIESLGPDHREALILRYYGELTVPEIAEALGCREGTVKSRLNRALARLEQDLSPRRPLEVAHES